jgi:hypothetical protein
VIRKLVFSLALCFVFFWFAGAYLVKGRIISILSKLESDNVTISYEKVSLSGFPNEWRISLLNPKLTFIDHVNSKQISAPIIDFLIDLSFKKAAIEVGPQIIQDQNFDQESTSYTYQADEIIKANIKFTKPLYRLDSKKNLNEIIKQFKLKINEFTINSEQKLLCRLVDLLVNLSKTDGANTIKIYLNYEGNEEIASFTEAVLKVDMAITSLTEPTAQKNIRINELSVTLDGDNNYFDGDLELVRGKLPQGNLMVKLDNYEKLIEQVIPTTFSASKMKLKELIEDSNTLVETAGSDRSLDNTLTKKAKFKMDFTNEGILIGEKDIFTHLKNED